MGRRSGFSLVEVLIAVVIVGVMSLMAYPRVSRSMIKSDLRGGRTRLANMFATARAAATQNSRTITYVRFNGNTAVVTAKPRRTDDRHRHGGHTRRRRQPEHDVQRDAEHRRPDRGQLRPARMGSHGSRLAEPGSS